MKSLVIDASKGKETGCMPPFKEGEIVNVDQSPAFIGSYDVTEYPFCDCCLCGGTIKSWNKSRFISISNHDETETEVYKQLQTQTAGA